MKAISEGTEVSAQDTITTAAADHATTRSRSGSTTRQNATPEVQRLNALARGQPHPDRHDHRDADPAQAPASSSGRSRSCERIEQAPCTCGRRTRAAGDRAGAAPRSGSAAGAIFSDVDLTRRPRRVRRGARAQRRRQVDADAGDPRAASRWTRAASPCSAARPARRGPGSATCPSAAASTAPPGSAASTWCGSASTAPAGACRSPSPPAARRRRRDERARVERGDRAGRRRRLRAPADRRAVGRRAAAAADRPGAGPRAPSC